MGLFGDDSSKKGNLQQQIRQNKRTIDKTIVEIDRAIQQMQTEENRQKKEVKKALKDQQPASAKILAKNIVRVRNNMKRMYQMRANMNALQLRVQTVASTQQMLDCMKGVGVVLKNMNKNMNIAGSNDIMKQFLRENDEIGLKMDMIDSSLDDAFSEMGEEGDSDEVVDKIIAEIQVEEAQKQVPIGTGVVNPQGLNLQAQPIATGGGNQEDDLENRLNQLRRT
ncbi:MAG: putative SNF7 family protein [Streblomastix strix]|nr:MAG: putative SNF7 family protein [Streblomastix strix]